MTEEDERRTSAPRKATRTERLEAELKANLKKRKQQKPVREVPPPPSSRDDGQGGA